jgi:hypothetical protein
MTYYYPATFYNLGAVILVIGAGLVGAANQGRMMSAPDAPGALTVKRISEGFAGLALAAYILHSAAQDYTDGFAAVLAFLFKVLPAHYDIMPPLVLLSVACLALLIIVSAFRAFAGFGGPFPVQKAFPVGFRLALLGIGAGLWLFGFFVPPSWEWGGFGEGVNFALRGYYLFMVVDSLVALAVLFGAGGSFRRIIERHQRERNAPLRGVGSGSNGSRAGQFFKGAVSLVLAAAVVLLGLAVYADAVWFATSAFGMHGAAGKWGGRAIGFAIFTAGLWWGKYGLRKLLPFLPPRLVVLLNRWGIR